MSSLPITASARSAPAKKLSLPKTLNREPRLYLAGPIRGVADFAERFAHASGHLRSRGYRVFNPVEQDAAFERHGTPIDVRHCLELDLVWICRWADVVGLLMGWEVSSGAMAEFYTAKAIGIETWELPRELQLP